MLTAGRSIVAAEGAAGLLTGMFASININMCSLRNPFSLNRTGFGPTAVGYLAQGGAKFAGYECVIE